MGDDDGAYLTDSRWQAQDNRSMVVKSGEGGGGRRIVMSFSGSSSWMPSTSGNFWWFSLLLSALRFHIVVIIIIMGKHRDSGVRQRKKNSCELVDGWKVEEKSQTTRALINSKITYRLTKSFPFNRIRLIPRNIIDPYRSGPPAGLDESGKVNEQPRWRAALRKCKYPWQATKM